MQLKLSDISPGDIIEYESWGCNHGGMQERLTQRKGKVMQVTDRVITLQGKNYPETILVNDLLSGRAKILKVKMRGEDDMAKYDWDTLWPQVQELQAQGKPLVTIADEININIHTLKSKLWRERQKEEQQTPTLEPEQAANQEPIQEEKEPAEDSIPYSVERLENIGREINLDDTKIYVPERQNYTITQYNEQIKQGAVTIEDEEEPPYGVTFPEHHEIAWEIASLLDLKRQDYGTENIKKFGSYGVLVRVSDKVERLINLSRKEGQVNFESVEDSWKDIAGYAVLALIELREGR